MKRLITRIAILSLLLLLGRQEGNLSFAQRKPVVLGVEQGLSQATVRSIAQGPEGFLWIATWGGLDRYDGHVFKNYSQIPGDPSSLMNNNLVNVSIDGMGRPWVTSIDEKVAVLDPLTGKFTLLTHKNGEPLLAEWGCYPVKFDKNSMVLLSNKGMVLVNEHDLSISILAETKEIAFTEVVEAFPLGKSLYLIEKAKRVKKIQVEFEVTSVSRVSDGRFLFVGLNGELHEFDLKTGKSRMLLKLLKVKFPASYYTFQIHTDSKGFTRILTAEGCFLLDADMKLIPGLFTEGDESTFRKGVVYSFCEDIFGNSWVGTGTGLIKVPGRKQLFKNFPEDGDLQKAIGQEMLITMLHIPGSKMLIGTTGGLYTFNPADQSFKKHPGIVPGEESVVVYRLFKDNKGGLWTGTKKGFLKLSLNGENLTSKMTRFKPPGGNVEWTSRILSIVEADNGDLWLGSINGIVRFSPSTGDYKTFYFHCNFGDEGDNYILSLFIDGGILWAGTNSEGLLRINTSDMTYTRYSTQPESRLKLLSDKIMTITKDRDGNIWAGTMSGGINIISQDLKTVRYLTTKNGLMSNLVFGQLADRAGFMWVSTSKGLARVDIRTLKTRNYTKSEGVLSADFNQNGYYAGPDGKFYFAGSRGITVFDPKNVQRSGIIPKLTLTDLKVLNEPALHRIKNGELVLDHNENFLSFEMAAITFEDPSYNIYLWKLEGLTDEWVNAGNRRTVDVSNLPPGEYTLKAKATNGDDGWSGETVLARIVVVPPFWMTGWFAAIAGLFLTGIIVLATYILSRRKLNREIAELEKEKMIMLERTKTRDKIARDLHDDLASTVSGAGLYMQSATNILGRDVETAKKMIEKSASLLTEAEQAMRDIVWSVSPQYDTVENLALRIRILARELCEAAGIKFEFERSGDSSGILGDELRRNLYLSAKEAVLNAVKHSGADAISILVKSESGIITIRISDNGRGFRMESNAEKLGGNGLTNIRKRCEEIGATSKIESFEGKGTTVTINCGIEK